MNLYATIESERGKEVTKSGNEYLVMKVQNKDKEYPLRIEVRPRPNSKNNSFNIIVHYDRSLVPDGIKRIPW